MPKASEFYINGILSDHSESPLSLSTPIHNWGIGIFETLLFQDGNWVLLNRHENRFHLGLKILKWDVLGAPAFMELIQVVRRHSQVLSSPKAVRVRITLYKKSEENSSNDFHWTAELQPLESNPWNQSGVNCLGWVENNGFPEFPDFHFKHTKRSAYESARQIASENHWDEVLICGKYGIADSLNSNVFFLQKETIFTPYLDSGCLNGTLRELLIEEIPKRNIALEITKMNLEMACRADAILLTNSVRGIQVVGEFSGRILDVHHPYISVLKEIANSSLNEK